MLRILMLEDVESDAQLARLELQRAKIEFSFSQVMTKESFLRELKEFQPDLILSDYSLPQFTGLHALQLTKEKFPCLPFILVTGSTNEEIAVECMKKGADDYVLKRSLKRLPAAIFNVLEKQQVQKEKKEAQEKYQSLFENCLDGIYRIDKEGIFLDVNPALVKMLGYKRKEELLHNKEAINLLKLQKERKKTWMINIAGEENEKQIWIEDNWYVVLDEKGEIAYYEGIIRDITERKKAEEIIKYQSFHDLLTELPNRTLFINRFNWALAQAKYNGQMLTVISLDLDRFKVINDNLGHAQGDILLKQVSERLSNCRAGGDTLARMGGDEFAFLLLNISTPEEAAKMAEKIHLCLQEPFILSGHHIYITTSIGISFYPADVGNGDDLLRNSEIAMYRIKRKGGNSYQFYTPAVHDKISARLSLENSIRSALKTEQFLVYYQPQVDLKKKRIVGVEALVRWQHPQLGLISPANFIPLAEETGLIIPLGEYVLEKACHQWKMWEKAGCVLGKLAVNLSARQFQQENLLQMINDVLKRTGLDSHYLELELTESSIMHDIDFTVDILQQLRAREITIAIDDFGTGYSSLNYLKKLPLNTLKIDKSFLPEFSSNKQEKEIVSAIIVLANRLGMTVTAEGVEKEEQIPFLEEQNCDKIQGYLFSPPVPPLEMWELMKKNCEV